MDTNLIVYEFPLSEQIRIFMRVEQLFAQIDYFLQQESVWDSQAALYGLLDILSILVRNDIKSDILMQVDRNLTILNKISHTQNLDLKRLQQLWAELEKNGKALHAVDGKIGLDLIHNDFLKSVSQRRSIPGGSCAFDLPELFCWLQRPDAQRKEDLQRWLSPLEIVRHAIGLIMAFIRSSADFEPESASGGYFQQSLDRTRRYHLLRVGLVSDLPYYAEVSGGKQRFTIRFINRQSGKPTASIDQPIEFQLARCLSN